MCFFAVIPRSSSFDRLSVVWVTLVSLSSFFSFSSFILLFFHLSSPSTSLLSFCLSPFSILRDALLHLVSLLSLFFSPFILFPCRPLHHRGFRLNLVIVISLIVCYHQQISPKIQHSFFISAKHFSLPSSPPPLSGRIKYD